MARRDAFLLIPAGSFFMGSPKSEDLSTDDERPRHEVTVSKPFYLATYEVTQAFWVAVMGDNPSHFPGERHPVDSVTWDEARLFIQKLNGGSEGRQYRLPTEAEWEMAARAGSQTSYFFGNDRDHLGDYAWHDSNSDAQTHPVGLKKPNPWGLYDIYGNVREWVQDYYGEYAASPQVDPTGPSSGGARVSRGGSWDCRGHCRSADRESRAPDERSEIVGLRLAYSAD
ncbi:MAG: formylglycine-generating enzyme family protein [Deltaproteobacteria bacterium]|nr:formylglycine-generating enzyme family protein [Deltaproteobacteria bacterium]